jgi:uncharacterized membrane protein YfcA
VHGTTILTVVLVGGAVGFLGGLFGKGGSAIASPLLGAAGIAPIVAVASPLPATIPGMLAASAAYWRERLVDWHIVRWSIALGVPATAAGAYATRWIGGGPLLMASEALLAALGVRLLVHPDDPTEVAAAPAGERIRLVAIALVVGAFSGLLANGGGFLLAPLYVLVMRMPIKQAFASSLIVATALAIPGTILHAALGHIDWALVGAFSVAAFPLSYVGARVAIRSEGARLQRIYGAMLLLLGICTLALNA